MRRTRLTPLYAMASLLLAAAPAAGEPSAEQRSAAMAQGVRPGGFGGCIYFGVSSEVRRKGLMAYMQGQPAPPELHQATEQLAPRCTGRAYTPADFPLVGAVTSIFRKTAMALTAAQAHGIGQQRLDAAWAGAPAQLKAPFYALADAYLDPQGKIDPQAPLPDVSTVLQSLDPALAGDARAASVVRAYFVATALNERSEAQLKAEGAKPAS